MIKSNFISSSRFQSFDYNTFLADRHARKILKGSTLAIDWVAPINQNCSVAAVQWLCRQV